ncbi:uncharacterized protein BKCO1_1100080 [Diplodia corticola]|uniref:Uncharacterized protein n=1 Tax=Diplodia corticola TaxID=236234 RepID=A0A1J9R8M3_9PEZI|nr:uncharacterized protein BKCO1_1100080 [Diplodia corticola]OJD36522.1 hypothetical protein BKCO1_1100080 [Diplodia corticola]
MSSVSASLSFTADSIGRRGLLERRLPYQCKQQLPSFKTPLDHSNLSNLITVQNKQPPLSFVVLHPVRRCLGTGKPPLPMPASAGGKAFRGLFRGMLARWLGRLFSGSEPCGAVESLRNDKTDKELHAALIDGLRSRSSATEICRSPLYSSMRRATPTRPWNVPLLLQSPRDRIRSCQHGGARSWAPLTLRFALS